MNGAPSFTFLGRTFFVLMLICFLGSQATIAQIGEPKEHVITAKKSDFVEKQVFKNELSQYDLYDFSSQEIFTAINKARGEKPVTFAIGNHQWDVVLRPSNILKESFVSRINSSNGVQQLDNIQDYTFEGYVVDENISVRITSTPNYFVAYFKTPDTEFYIEPTSKFTNTLKSKSFVMYKKRDVLPTAGTCLTIEAKEWDKTTSNAHYLKSDGCLEVDYALAADFAMFQKYGSPENILLHVSTVLNMVNVDYENAFSDELRFIISEQMTSTCSNCNPWSSTTNAQDLLKNFDDWGPTGFVNEHDLGSLWTDRNFDGTTVAVAWIGKVCTSKRYNCVQDFTSSYGTLRMVNSHELGHNFDAHHDPSFTQFIMTSAVNASFNVWSPATIAEINAHINSRDCLTECQEVVTEEPVESEPIHVTLSAKVQLMGFFDKNLGAMSNKLNELNLIPSQQPFNNEIWNYQGTETVDPNMEGILDWVLVELRNDENPDEVLARKAVLIKESGDLVNPDGSSEIFFETLSDGNYYVAIHHKSHLRMRTSSAHNFIAGESTSLDFTQTGENALSNHLTEYVPGVSVVYCGDYDQSGTINFLDLTTWVGSYQAGGIYHFADGNGDGLVDLADIVYWLDYQNVFSF